MKTTSILCVATVLIGLPGMAWGHYPEGVTFFAFQWPEGYEPVMDGDLSEWEMIPKAYIQDISHFFEVSYNSAPDPSNLDIKRCIVGWSESQNKLYFVAEVFDDVHKVTRTGITTAGNIWIDDFFDIMVDADHSGGKYRSFESIEPEHPRRWDGAQAIQYILSVPPPDDRPFEIYNYATWNYAPPWSEVGWNHVELPSEGGSITSYECALIAFDDLNWMGPDQSKIHNLEQGEVIGVNVALGDWDLDPKYIDGYWSLSPKTKTYKLAERLTDFLLAPVEERIFEGATAVESVTWGRIKAGFLR